jgi:hypothetical protein
MNLSGVNVANCDGVTLKGLKALVNSETLRAVDFSTDKLTEADVVELVNSFKKIRNSIIVDPKGKVDVNAIQTLGATRHVEIVVRPTGALQDMGLAGKKPQSVSE